MKKALKEYKKSAHLAEIFQSVDIKFSFLKKDTAEEFSQITAPAKCRDFLGDVLWSKETGKSVVIYGFKYDYKADPFDEEALQLSLTFPSQESLDAFKSHLDFIHEKEDTAGVSRTEVYETDDKGTLILVADPSWQKSPWRISLYTYYVKLASYPDMTKLESPEKDYAKVLTKEKESVLLANVKSTEKYFHAAMYANHEEAGIVATIKGHNGDASTIMFNGGK